MVNVSQEMKEVIERHGHMVIEFKMWCRKLAVRISDMWRALAIWIWDFVEKIIFPAFEKLKEHIGDVCDFCNNHIELRAKKKYTDERYTFVRKLGRKYEPKYMKRPNYYRCRNNC